MSFQETRSAISICNRALSRIAQVPLQGDLDDPANDNKLAARECRLWYKPTVRRLLEQHHWHLATKRAALAELTNDREAEWVAKYQPPSDMAFPVSLAPVPEGSTISYYRGINHILGILYGRPVFRYEGGVLYSAVADASINYVSFDITEADFNDTLEDMIVQFLSAKLARSVAKDFKLAAAYEQQAIADLNLAIAQSLNMQQPRYDQGFSEAELAREGGYYDGSPFGPYGFYR